jgi:hypothetical protein
LADHKRLSFPQALDAAVDFALLGATFVPESDD